MISLTYWEKNLLSSNYTGTNETDLLWTFMVHRTQKSPSSHTFHQILSSEQDEKLMI